MQKQPEAASNPFTSPKSEKNADSRVLIDSITNALLEKKGRDIVLLDVRGLTTLTDFFIVCHGTSDTQIKALADHVHRKTVEINGEKAWKKEGADARRWIILDYVNVVVHIFNEEKRNYYGIERMWNDAARTDIADEK